MPFSASSSAASSVTDVVIVGAARTPVGAFLGGLAAQPAAQLGGVAIKAALERAGVAPDRVGEVVMGSVLTAGQGQAPARQAAHTAGLPRAVPASVVSKVCGSGLKAVQVARNAILAGDHEVVVAGGMESMSQAPYLLPKAREGLRMGNAPLVDSMIHDGLWDAYGDQHMGSCAELCARERGISREQQDAYAAESFRRARAAQEEGHFAREIVPVEIAQRKGPALRVDRDEGPAKGDLARLPSLRPAFVSDGSGTITAGNASQLSDGAAALVLTSGAAAQRLELTPLARVLGFGAFAQDPAWFTTAPAGAVERLLATVGWRKDEVDLWEINEAFAVVALANNQLLELDPARVNVWGGAVALGHPIGATGARLLVTLINALTSRGDRRGVAALCIGGGEGLAVAIERL